MLELHGVQRRMGNQSLGPININVEPGTIHAIIGNNGAGKSTLFEAIAGDYPGEGTIVMNGYANASVEGKAQFSYVPQSTAEIEYLSLKKLQNVHQSLDASWDDERFQSIVKAFNVPLKQKITLMSVGMKQKALLSLQLSRCTPLLILDEPYTGLDMEGQSLLDRLLFKHMEASDEHSIVLATHIADEVQRLADVVSFLKDGKIERTDDKDLLQERFKRIWIDHRVEGIDQAPGVLEVGHEQVQEVVTSNAVALEAWLQEKNVAIVKSQRLKLHESIPYILKNNVREHV